MPSSSAVETKVLDIATYVASFSHSFDAIRQDREPETKELISNAESVKDVYFNCSITDCMEQMENEVFELTNLSAAIWPLLVSFGCTP